MRGSSRSQSVSDFPTPTLHLHVFLAPHKAAAPVTAGHQQDVKVLRLELIRDGVTFKSDAAENRSR
ncbi:hypothetical protein E2C01_033246 [Portunus trituberculatus]|uniref:Uncharacterized protein n=1 Tax=Portunus trituberculatus TaxID=210409 RepID=A0A5B7EY80_PORTR|nr:hypothetical protein [Portunus trituberculatus]